MVILYWVAAVVGGVMVLISALAGGHHGDSDAGHDVGHDGPDVGHDHGDFFGEAAWSTVFSLRFWTYAFAGFGLTGLLLTYLTPSAESLTLGIAIGTGLVAGLIGALILRLARKAEADSSVRAADLGGHEGQVLVALRGANPGRVRLFVKGEWIDYLAIADGGETVEAGEQVIVVALEGDRLRVIPKRSLMEEAVASRS